MAPPNLAMTLPVAQLAHVLGPPDRATHCEGYYVTDLPKSPRCPGSRPSLSPSPSVARPNPFGLFFSNISKITQKRAKNQIGFVYFQFTVLLRTSQTTGTRTRALADARPCGCLQAGQKEMMVNYPRKKEMMVNYHRRLPASFSGVCHRGFCVRATRQRPVS